MLAQHFSLLFVMRWTLINKFFFWIRKIITVKADFIKPPLNFGRNDRSESCPTMLLSWSEQCLNGIRLFRQL